MGGIGDKSCRDGDFPLDSSSMFKKVLLPLLLIVVSIVLLSAAAYWYESKWGSEGPFPSHHHH